MNKRSLIFRYITQGETKGTFYTIQKNGNEDREIRISEFEHVKVVGGNLLVYEHNYSAVGYKLMWIYDLSEYKVHFENKNHRANDN